LFLVFILSLLFLVLIFIPIFWHLSMEGVLGVLYIEALYIVTLILAVLGFFLVLGLSLKTGSFHAHYLVESDLFFFLALYSALFILFEFDPFDLLLRANLDLLNSFGFIMLIVYIAVSLFLSTMYCMPVVSCCEKPSYSWGNLLTALKYIWRTGGKLVTGLLEKALSYAIFIGPFSIIISYLFVNLGVISAEKFGTSAFSIFNILILAVLYIEMAYVFFKRKWKNIKALQVGRQGLFGKLRLYVLYTLYVIAYIVLPIIGTAPAYFLLISLETGELAYTRETYGYALIALLFLIYFITNIATLDCAFERDKMKIY